MSSFARRVAQAFDRAFRSRPYVTQTATTVVAFATADVAAQNMTEKDYELIHTLRSTAIGASAALPMLWGTMRTSRIKFGGEKLSLLTRILVYQFTMSATVNVYFFGSQALLAGEGLHQSWLRVRDNMPRTWFNGWFIWPAVSAINFSIMPVHYRAVFPSFVNIFWQIYMAWKNRRAEIAEHKDGRMVEVIE
ncbi:hypothetical protein F5Y15DRAFT_416530 [Xylariaceae sp. FL0016]|nr:hypothetical protein F5Y15DRAFT_416530 [Xylariaceae sp. FL0016]